MRVQTHTKCFPGRAVVYLNGRLTFPLAAEFSGGDIQINEDIYLFLFVAYLFLNISPLVSTDLITGQIRGTR